MKNIKRFTCLLLLILSIVGTTVAQPYPRKESNILDNKKRITDANTSLYNLYSEYDFPYLIPTREDITEKLLRILNFLEKSTAAAIVNPETGKTITDYKNFPANFQLEEGDFKPYTYEWGVTYSGMMRAATVTGDKRFNEYTVKRMKLLSDALPTVKRLIEKDDKAATPFNDILKPHNLDQSGSICAAMIRANRVDKSLKLDDYIRNSIDWVFNKQFRLDDGTLARKGPYENTLWMDDMYMSIPALAEMYRTTGDERYLNDAAKQVLQFAKRLFVKERKIYMHSWTDVMEYHPKLYWGRANGWATLAMADLLEIMPANHPDRQAVLDQFKAHCEGLLELQSGKGMWHQLLDRNDSYLESSATAMFVYGFAYGINNGWLDAKAFGPATLTGWNALSDQINNMGQIENVCVGTGISYEAAYYYNRHVHVYTAHGYGPVLLAGAEVLKMLESFNVQQGTSIMFLGRKK